MKERIYSDLQLTSESNLGLPANFGAQNKAMLYLIKQEDTLHISAMFSPALSAALGSASRHKLDDLLTISGWSLYV